ncbi:MAG: signal recognition particle protein [Lachnospiraceae bacterium]|nr:signal recognition particle protein [Lachnospiraceae bacterium]
MAFESLTDKLQNVFKNLRGKGRLTELDVKTAMREVKMALLEADVNFKVVKQFVKSVEERAVGSDVLNGLNPGQMVIKIVNEEMTALMGSEVTDLELEGGKNKTVIMMCGLQGSGKTTTAAKLAQRLSKKGKKTLLVACDVYRPAAFEQLKVNAEKVSADFFGIENEKDPVKIASQSLKAADENGDNVVILDTAGRLQIDDVLMDELVRIENAVTVNKTLLVVDAMTGQEAVNVSQTFNDKIGIDGVVLSKMDGDARGGAALSVKAVTGKPILFVGMGEKLDALEPFYPDRMASRILGMGDVLTLIDKAAEQIDAAKEKEMSAKLKKGKFDFDDYLESMNQMKKMGGLTSVMSMLPGMGNMFPGGAKMGDLAGQIDEKKMNMTEAIVLSMTKAERSNPDLLNPSRKHRIAKGAGVDIAEVNRLVKQFKEAQKMMKRLPQMMGKRGRMRFPF